MKPRSLPEGRIVLPTPEGLQAFLPGQVRYCKADGNYTWFHIAGRETAPIICQTLKKTEEQLRSKDFFRTDKSFLVNRAVRIVKANCKISRKTRFVRMAEEFKRN